MRLNVPLVQIAGFLASALLAFSAFEALRQANGSGDLLGRFSVEWSAILVLIGLLGGVLGLVALWALARPGQFLERGLLALDQWLANHNVLRWILLITGVALPTILFLGPLGSPLTSTAWRFTILLGSAFVVGLSLPWLRSNLAARMAGGLLLSASLLAATKRLALITRFPFKLGWSEGNRLWDYSLYFVGDRYEVLGDFILPNYLTPGRHGLWGLPFLVPGVGIEWVRFWDALLWVAPYLLLGVVLFARRPKNFPLAYRLGLVLWTFLFLSQGPIYAPLVWGAVLLFWLYDPDKRWRSLAVTALACFYVGISRWTWMLAPAVWVAVWAFVEIRSERQFWERIRFPIALGMAGFSGAIISQLLTRVVLAQPESLVPLSLSQPLLWYRLLPNPTFPLGILPALALAVGPLLGLLAWVNYKRFVDWDGWKILAVWGSLAGFLAAGLTASVKIGGGSNLHNLDMFLVGLLLYAALALFEIQNERRLSFRAMPSAAQGVLALLIIIPTCWTVLSGTPLRLPSQALSNSAVEQIQELIDDRLEDGEVLFIDQRQLLTFGAIEGAPLIMDYELKDVMNQAMASNKPYFERFYAELDSGRFSLIVIHPLSTSLQGRSHQFGEENDAWVRYVAIPMLERYEPVLVLDDIPIWLMAPKPPAGG